MAGNSPPPDYDLADRIALTEASQVKAISHPLRTTILSLLHERAATVTELAVAGERPKSTGAHHVKVLREAGPGRGVPAGRGPGGGEGVFRPPGRGVCRGGGRGAARGGVGPRLY